LRIFIKETDGRKFDVDYGFPQSIR